MYNIKNVLDRGKRKIYKDKLNFLIRQREARIESEMKEMYKRIKVSGEFQSKK